MDDVLVVDLNADAGESFGGWHMGNDMALFPSITSVNLACGSHAGDPLTMSNSVAAAVQEKISIGAHPGYPDLAGFGRRQLSMNAEELYASIIFQLGALDAFARLHGTKLRHVKAHGALYLQMMRDHETANAFAAAVRAYDPSLPIMVLGGPGGTQMQTAAKQHNLKILREAFPDRAYFSDGQLTPRSIPNSLVLDPEEVAERAVAMVLQKSVSAIDGGKAFIEADTLCIHGDNEAAPQIAAAVRKALEDAGVRVQAP